VIPDFPSLLMIIDDNYGECVFIFENEIATGQSFTLNTFDKQLKSKLSNLLPQSSVSVLHVRIYYVRVNFAKNETTIEKK
jgi:hypothetical protein